MPRHGTIAAYLALFIALGGTATAATQLDRNSVGTQQIRNGSIKPADLARKAKPIKATRSVAAFESAVGELVTTDEVLLALADAVEGDPGPKGEKGDPVPGPQGASGQNGATGAQGAQGGSGPQGVTGDIRAYGTIPTRASAESGSVVGSEYTQPTDGVTCIRATGQPAKIVVANPSEAGAFVTVIAPKPASDTSNPCTTDDGGTHTPEMVEGFAVLATNAAGDPVDVGLHFMAN